MINQNNKKILLFFTVLLTNITCMKNDIINENNFTYDRTKENFRLHLKNGKFIECIIISASPPYLNIYAYDFNKIFNLGIKVLYIMKDGSEYYGILRKIDKNIITIIVNPDQIKNERQLDRKDIFSIVHPKVNSILKRQRIKIDEISVIEILKNRNPYFGIMNILSIGDRISLLTNSGKELEGKISLLSDKDLIMVLSHRTDTESIQWSEIVKINIIQKFYNNKKSIIHVLLAFTIFIIIVGSLTSINLNGMGH